MATAYIVPGVRLADPQSAILTAIILGVINTFIKPVLVVLTLPLTVLTLGLFIFVINAIVLWLADKIVPGFTIDNFISAILGAIVLSVASTALSMVARDMGRVKGR